MAYPSLGTEQQVDNWGRHFDMRHHNNIRWYMNYEQNNLQIAVHVMLMSKPDSINIVQLSPLHRAVFIDNVSPRTVNLLSGEIAGACWSDTVPQLGTDGQYLECTWQKNMDVIGDQESAEQWKQPNTDKDKQYVEAYRQRNYVAQAKWELHTAIAMMDAHAKATGHDIRIIPQRARDHNIETLSPLNKLQCKEIQNTYNHNRIFWYKDENGKNIGSRYYPKDKLDHIVDNYLQPWLDKDI
tara:strand:+ start:178 stop:897 length:720 start_codon:yes stop_codon:yes gene_type:complete